jgi:glycosyltransferase involved in cell wall biosynthesis
MTEVHQVLVAASFGDAITNEAVGLQRAIKQRFPGVASDIFAYHRGPGMDAVRPLSEYQSATDGGDSVLLFHSSIGEPAMSGFLAARQERTVVRYHNITPAAWFAPYDPAFARLLDLGRAQLTGLRDRTVLAIADSRFNQGELAEAGFENTTVVPVHADLRALQVAVAERPSLLPPPRTDAEPVVLFVGRRAPNKGHVGLLQAFHVLKTYRHHDAHLWMAGGTALPRYSWALEQYRRELGLSDAHFAGTVSTAGLSYMYRRADVLLCLSQHEGFGVPLVEAMAFDVPIVALNRTAVPETLGGAGLLLDEPSPELVAEAVSSVISRPGLRDALVERGRRRLEELRPQDAAGMFVDALERAIA